MLNRRSAWWFEAVAALVLPVFCFELQLQAKQMEMSALPDRVVADGKACVFIQVRLRNLSNSPMPGATVHVWAQSGDIKKLNWDKTVKTNKAGVARLRFPSESCQALCSFSLSASPSMLKLRFYCWLRARFHRGRASCSPKKGQSQTPATLKYWSRTKTLGFTIMSRFASTFTWGRAKCSTASKAFM